VNGREIYRGTAVQFRTAIPICVIHKGLFLKIAAAFLILVTAVSCTEIARLAGLQTEVSIPTARVVREPVDVKIHTLGELLPARTATIVAPPVAGGMLQIIYLAEDGTFIKQGDIVVQFDPSEQQYNLGQSKSQLEEAEQQIIKMKADQAVRVAQEQVSLLQAQFEVQRAELKVKGNDLLSGIEARKNELSLEEAERRLEQLQRDIKSRAESDAADLAVQNVARTKAMLGIKLAQQFIDNMTCRAPISGIVVVGQSIESLMSASGNISISSDSDIPKYQSGSPAYPGRAIASIQEVDQIEVTAKVIETDRGNIKPGQAIEAIVDSKPLKVYSGRIKSLAQSALSTANVSTTIDLIDALSTRSFPVVFEVDTEGDRLNLGVTARVTIMGTNMREALSIPRQALHQKEGKPVVYVQNMEDFEPQEVQVKYLTESRAIIDGIDEGTEVALVNPEQQKDKTAGKREPLAPVLGGGAR
jgi:multidrug resistance efflux pump